MMMIMIVIIQLYFWKYTQLFYTFLIIFSINYQQNHRQDRSFKSSGDITLYGSVGLDSYRQSKKLPEEGITSSSVLLQPQILMELCFNTSPDNRQYWVTSLASNDRRKCTHRMLYTEKI
jgi:hypothetical protein